MSEGLYVPRIQVMDYAKPGETFTCDYRSPAAMEAGLSDPKHWAHAVYNTLLALCAKHQTALQGGAMDEYWETEIDRMEANS